MKNQHRQHEDVRDRAVDGVFPLRKRHLGRSDKNAAEYQAVQHHDERETQNYPDRDENDLPAPRQEPIELERYENELKSVDRKEQLKLEASLVLLLDGPDAKEHADDARDYQWDEHQNP